MNRRRNFIIVMAITGIVFVALIVLSIVVALNQSGSNIDQGTETIVYTDPDTGEVLTSFPGVEPENVGNPEVTLLGMTQLNNDLVRPQYNFIRDELSTYSQTVLNNQYSTMTILPDSYNNSNGSITCVIRLGKDEDNTINATIEALRTGETRLVITDPSGKFSGYDSGETNFYGD